MLYIVHISASSRKGRLLFSNRRSPRECSSRVGLRHSDPGLLLDRGGSHVSRVSQLAQIFLYLKGTVSYTQIKITAYLVLVHNRCKRCIILSNSDSPALKIAL